MTEATGDSHEYRHLLQMLAGEGPAYEPFVKLAVLHILKRLGPPEPDAEQALAEAAEAFYGSHKRT